VSKLLEDGQRIAAYPMTRARNYKREYRRRLQLRELREQHLAPVARKRRNVDYDRLKTTIKRRVRKDARDVFKRAEIPKRAGEYDPDEYEQTLQALIKKRAEGKYDWTDEKAFVNSMLALGLTARDSYTMWFSP
jgi:hypothetical protein